MTTTSVTRRIERASLVGKITIVNLLLMGMGLLGVGIGTWLLLRPALVESIDGQLRTAANNTSIVVGGSATGNSYSPAAIRAAPSQYLVSIVTESGRVRESNTRSTEGLFNPNLGDQTLREVFGANLDKIVEVRDSDGRVTWRAIVAPTQVNFAGRDLGWMVIGAPLNPVDRTVSNFLVIFCSLGLLVLVINAAVARLVVNGALNPLRQVERAVAKIAAGDLRQRVPDRPTAPEVGRLTKSLNVMLSRLDRAFFDRTRTIKNMRAFVGDASHELRTPLVTMRGYAELYRMGALATDEDVANAMTRIEREAIRMGGLVEDLLQLARLDENREIVHERVELEPVLFDAAMDARASASDRTVAVLQTLVVPPEFASPRSGEEQALAQGAVPLIEHPELGLHPADIAVIGEENKLRQAVQNLIGNALRHTPDGTRIELGLTVFLADRTVGIDIIDHGPGIDEAIKSKIFERFWRADSSRTRATGGSGLGLAIVTALVSAHNGTTSVIDSYGGGATFRIRLPLAPPKYAVQRH